MKICVISDVHGKWNKITIPECDILISCGDFSFQGEKHMVEDFHAWLNKQPAKHVISVMGNHETWVEKNFQEAKQLAIQKCPRVHFMDEGLVEIEGLSIWCSAITPFFCNWAWNRYPEEIKDHWDKIPLDIDILVTHGPPYGILDKTVRGDLTGCQDLLNKLLKTKVKYHLFGHIHESYGTLSQNNITFINASICDENYKPINKPIVFGIKNSS